jgi:hypothetical protein
MRFGAVARVDSKTQISTGIAWPAHLSEFNPKSAISLAMEAGDAKTLRKRLKILLQGKLKSPYVVVDQDYSEATIDEPTNFTSHKSALVVIPICASIYDPAEGKILASWPATVGPLGL